MDQPGPTKQPPRPLPTSMFQNQQNTGARGGPLGASRLQNGKLGSGSQWPFGPPTMPSAPGLATAPPRPNGSGLSSFAQISGVPQSHTSINNLEEFPSLSGTPQAHQNPSAPMWSNPTLRTTQHSTIQRPQMQTPTPTQGPAAHPQHPQHSQHPPHPQLPSQPSEEGAAGGGGGDDFRFGGQAGVGQLSGGGAQPQTGNIEEFPPLGGGAGDVGPDRRTGMIQNAAAYGSNPSIPSIPGNPSNPNSTSAFPGLGQTRNGLSSPTDDRSSIHSAVGGRAAPGSRTAFDGMRGIPAGLQDVQGSARAGQALGNTSFAGAQQPPRQQPIPLPYEQSFAAEAVGSPIAQLPQHKKLSDMTDSERYGLPGLLAMIPLESPDYSSLAVGQDLTVLGLDLGCADNSPLHPNFGSPFVESNVKPVIPPDFTLPAAYTVTNVPPLHSKISSFSAETLLAIFYQYPRDIMQEMAANELYNRDWRWHMKLQQWMMKDPDLPQPQRVSPKEERGWYLFFDVTNWRRERREFELNYDDLDQRHGPGPIGPSPNQI